MKSERRKCGRVLLFVVLFATSAVLSVSIGCASATTRYVNPGDSIQDVVDVADPGDIIIVRDGTYTENVVVHRRLTIRSENGSASTVVDAHNGDNGFAVLVDCVNISGFTVTNASINGIDLNSVSHCNISHNTLLANNHNGIWMNNATNSIVNNNNASFSIMHQGIGMRNCSHNNITGNALLSNNHNGLWMENSNNGTITHNSAYDNNHSGFGMLDCNHNTLENNNATANNLTGFFLNHSEYNDIIGNRANNNLNVGILMVSVSTNNQISNNNAYYNFAGIALVFSQNNNLTENNASANSDTGIKLNLSSNNALTNNTVSNNGNYGIWLRRSSYNTLRSNSMNNNFFFNIALKDSLTLEEWNNTIDDSNTANGLPVYYFYNQSNLVIDNYATNKIGIVGCTNVTVRNISFSHGDPLAIVFTNDSLIENCTVMNNNASGFVLLYSHNNSLTNNRASHNLIGFNVRDSTQNSIRANSITGNAEYGIELRNCSDNHIYNNYFESTNNAFDNGNNIWNISKSTGPNIVEGPYLGGNYWSDYAGSDNNEDGFGDTMLPYKSSGNIQKGGDWRPLVKPAYSFFDTGEGTYPSISGTHNGTITPACNITVSKLYTYPCTGTGGHTEYVKIWKEMETLVEESWNGYTGDWLYITFSSPTTLVGDETYNYTIVTDSYPQIIHAASKEVTGGIITYEEFVDVNGKRHKGGIPAIRLE